MAFCISGLHYGCVVLSPLAQKSSLSAPRKPQSPEKIDINTATVDPSKPLQHIGIKTAQAIIAYRAQYGPFKRIDDLTKVSGIGGKTFVKLKKHIILE